MKKRLRIGITIIFLFILTTLFFWYYIFDVASLGNDAAYIWYPHLSFIMNSFRNGQFPLWNPYDFCGRPCVSDAFTGVFYPLFWPLILFVNNGVLSFLAMEWAAILHIFLAGVFTYFFAREINLSEFACLIVAVTYMFGARLFAGFDSPPEVALIWFPFVLLFLIKALRKKDYLYSIIGGIGLGLSGLYIHPQLQIYLLYALGFYFIYHLLQRKEERFLVIRLFMVLLIAGFCLAAVQLLPVFELALNSTRAQISWSQSIYDSMHPKRLLGFLVPYFFVEPPNWQVDPGFEEYHIYIGILPLILSMVGMFFSSHPKRKFFTILFIITLLYGLGKYSPVQPIFYYLVPGFNKVRAPTRISWVYQFALAVLAGMGTDALLGLFKSKLKEKIYAFYKSLFKIAVVLSCITAVGTIFWLAWIVDFDFVTIKELGSTRMIKNTYIFLFLLWASFMLFKFLLENKIKLSTFKKLVLLLIITDLFYLQTKIHSYKRLPSQERFPMVKRVEFLRKDPGIFRVLTDYGDYERRDQVLKNNWGSVYAIFNAGGYAPMTLSLVSDLFRLPGQALIPLLNIKYIITKENFVNGGELVFKDNNYNVFQLNGFLPHVFFVKEFKVLSDKNEFLEYLSNSDPRETILLAEEPKEVLNTNHAAEKIEPDCEITKYANNSIDIKANVATDGFLVLSEIYYPGWYAYVDKVKTKIYRANYAFRAVYLSKGSHVVSMVYRPRSFYYGLLISMMALFAMMTYFVVRFYKDRSGNPTVG